MTIRLYDSLRREKVDFQPLKPGHVSIYVCGPTVYSNFHIGNARTFVSFDVVRRYLIYRGFTVTYIQNFTDVDDKIIKRAHEEDRSPEEVADTYIDEYYRDADALDVHRADEHPRATEHIGEMIALIERLIEKGHAYNINGDVYFDIQSFEGYGRLSGQDPEQLQEGVRIEVDQRLKNPLDFALWKSAKPGEPKWESPWGAGRPGWHIECSVMAEAYLGGAFDIHAGGRDLIFPHHENEVAQSHAAGNAFAHTWLHVGHLNIQGRKMSKSLGNYQFVRDMLADYSPETIRYFLLSAHYRKPIDFHATALQDAKAALMRVAIFRETVERTMASAPDGPEGWLGERAGECLRAFEEAMDDDFNVPKAYAVVYDLVRDVNKWLDDPAESPTREGISAVLDAIRTIGDVLGVFRESASGTDDASAELVDGLVQLLIEMRADARADKQWALADQIRDRLAALNITLEDTAEGTHWRRAT